MLAAPTLELSRQEATQLCDRFLQSYRDALQQGKAQWIEGPPPVEIVRNLLNQLAQRDRAKLLEKRTRFNEQTNQRQLIIDNERTLPLLEGQQDAIATFMPKFADQYLIGQQAKPELFQQLDGIAIVKSEFFNLLDVARRISGGGSLGLDRYVLLVEGEGSPNGNYLLDLKQAQPSSLEPYLKKKWKQPHWSSPAQRIVTIQNRVQAFTPALLSATRLGEKDYLLKELQPTKEPTDRVELKKLGQSAQLDKLMVVMGRVVAWGELRSSGCQRAEKVDELIDFAESKGWQKNLTQYARDYSKQVQKDWQKFSTAFDKGEFDVLEED